MATLSQAAIAMLKNAGCTEIADDLVVIGHTDLRVLLCDRAVRDLNAQAREDAAHQPAKEQ